MRIVSMVPSWTETLLKAGVQVVGRTRFCIHPPEVDYKCPYSRGTKEVSWDLVMDLKPGFGFIRPRGNPLEMAEECPLPYLATHVTSLETLQKEFIRFGRRIQESHAD